jgi:hypothetical protein
MPESILAQRIARVARWLEQAERFEAEVLAFRCEDDGTWDSR